MTPPPTAPSERLFSQPGPGRYVLACVTDGIMIQVDRLRQERDQLVGEIHVYCEAVPGGKPSNAGLISVGDFNFSSVSARRDRAKLLADRSRRSNIDWPGFLEELAQKVVRCEREGGPPIDLRTVQRPVEADLAWTIDGLPLMRRHPLILFGDGGTAKSYLALYFAGCLVKQGINVLYCDWELGEEEHRDRLERLFGALAMPQIQYIRCEHPLADEIDRISRIVSELKIGYVIFDSIVFACDGPPEDADTAGNYYRALRRLNIGSLHIAHISGSREADQRPFGSRFWHNGARSTWFVKRSFEGPDQMLTVGLFQRKSNLGPLGKPFALSLVFQPNDTQIVQTVLTSVTDLAPARPLWLRIAETLQDGPKSTRDIAETLGATETLVTRTVRRVAKKFDRTPIPGAGSSLMVSLNAPRAYFNDDPRPPPEPIALPLETRPPEPPPLSDADAPDAPPPPRRSGRPASGTKSASA